MAPTMISPKVMVLGMDEMRINLFSLLWCIGFAHQGIDHAGKENRRDYCPCSYLLICHSKGDLVENKGSDICERGLVQNSEDSPLAG